MKKPSDYNWDEELDECETERGYTLPPNGIADFLYGMVYGALIAGALLGLSWLIANAAGGGGS